MRRLLQKRRGYQQRAPDAFNHSALDAGLTQDVVGGDASLSTVDKLPPRDAAVHRSTNVTFSYQIFR